MLKVAVAPVMLGVAPFYSHNIFSTTYKMVPWWWVVVVTVAAVMAHQLIFVLIRRWHCGPYQHYHNFAWLVGWSLGLWLLNVMIWLTVTQPPLPSVVATQCNTTEYQYGRWHVHYHLNGTTYSATLANDTVWQCGESVRCYVSPIDERVAYLEPPWLWLYGRYVAVACLITTTMSATAHITSSIPLVMRLARVRKIILDNIN